MALAATLRSAARSLRTREPLALERRPLARRFLSSSSSVPTERHTCSPTSKKPLKSSTEKKCHAYEKPGDIYKRMESKVDMIAEGLEEHSRLLKELEAELKNNKRGGALDLTPWVLSISSCLISFGLYKYVS